MLLSIVVLSYNRPIQLRRILDHFIGFADNRVKLIIKDDQSPNFDEIEKIFNFYRNQIEIECELYRNNRNMGYDLNLWSSFWSFNSDYIFLLSDDDYIKTEFLSLLLDELTLKKYKFYFTPFIYNGVIGRHKIDMYDKKRLFIIPFYFQG
jgi:abequosyltransferase